MIKKLFLSLTLLFPALAFGQGSNYQAVILGSTGKPVGGAQVTVCAAGAPGIPCTPTVNIYSNQALTNAQSNPIITDAYGNFGFWAAPGSFEYTVTGLNVVAHGPFQIVLPCIVGASCASAGGLPNIAVAFSATPSFAATSNASYSMTLTGDVTAITITGTPVNGNLLRFQFAQDSAGSHVVTWPGNFSIPTTFAFKSAPSQINRMTFVYDGTNWQMLEDIPDGAWDYYAAPTFSATPTFANSRSAAFDFTLTGNVTASTFTTTGRAGTVFNLNLCEDGTGGRTFAFPGNVTNASGFSFDTTANHCNYLTYRYNGSAWTIISVGGSGGGGGTPANPVNSLQKNSSGSFGSTNVSEVGTNLTIDDNAAFKGPNPYVDPTRYGIRFIDPRFIPGVSGITGTITSGSASLTVSTSSCTLQVSNICFQNGDGIVVVGAGPSQSMTAPTPTVVPSIPSGPTGTVQVVNGPVGVTTYNYKIVAVDKGRGMTVPGTATTITNGQASLGARSVSITSCARSVATVTCLTASAHSLAVGGTVLITQASDGSFSGAYTVLTVPDTTHFTYASGFDTTIGATTSSTGGTARWFNENYISWSHVANAHQYIVCSDRAGGGYVAIGISKPDNTANSTTDMALSFDDLGSPMMDGFQLPYWAGANPCTAGSPQNDELVTTISSGAPGTTFTLAATASTSVTNQVVLFDDVPNFLTTIAASTNGPLSIPVSTVTNGGFVFNSYMTLPAQYDICQVGGVTINDTIQLTSGQRWSGACPPVGSSIPGAAWEAYSNVGVGPAYPGFYLVNGNIIMKSLQLVATGNAHVLALFDATGVPSGTLNNMNFVSGGSGDYMSMGLIFRGQPTNSPSTIVMNGNFLFTGGSGSGSVGSTNTPLFYADPGGMMMDHISLTNRGIAFKPPSSPGGVYQLINSIYMNGGVAPLITVTTGNGAGHRFHIGSVSIDTVGLPLFANLDNGGIGQSLVVDNLYSGPSSDGTSVPPLVSGSATAVYGDSVYVGAGYTRTFTYIGGTNGIGTNIFNSPLSAKAIQLRGEGYFSVGNTEDFFANALPQAAPGGAVVAGGTIPVGSVFYQTVPVWQNGGEGNYSSVATFTTTGGNQTVNLTWSAVPGNPLGYNIYRGTGGGLVLVSCTVPNATGTTYTDTGSTCSNTEATFPTGGPSLLDSARVAAPKFQGGGYATTPTSTKTSAYTATANDNIIPVDATAGNVTISLNPAIKGSHWTITRIDSSANTVSITPTSGTIDGAGSLSVLGNTSAIVTCIGGTNCQSESKSSAGGSGTINNASQFAQPYYSGVGSNNQISGVAPPSVNGTYFEGYQVVASAAVAPSTFLLGSNYNAQTGTTYTLGTTATDRAGVVDMGTQSTSTVTLPAISGALASNYVTRIRNSNTGNMTVTSTAPNAIDNGSAGGSITVLPGWAAILNQDNSPNWFSTRIPTFTAFPACADSAGQHLNFSSGSGITCGTTNSATQFYQTVAVGGSLQTQRTRLNLIAGTNISITPADNGGTNSTDVTIAVSGGAGTPCTTTALSLQYNSAGSFGCVAEWTYSAAVVTASASAKFDMSAANTTTAFKIPAFAAATVTAAGFSYDTTNKNTHTFSNGADAINVAIPSAPTTGDLADWSVASSVVQAHDSGILTANVVTAASAATTAGQLAFSTSNNKALSFAPLSPATLTDGATVTYALSNNPAANAVLTFTVHSGSRTMNITNPVTGGTYLVRLVQDATGGENLTGGTGCTWKQLGGGGSTFTLTATANAVDILTFYYDGTTCWSNLGKNYQ